MSNYLDLLQQYAFGTPSNVPTVPTQQAQTVPTDEAAYRIAAARTNGTGSSITDPTERDMIDLTTAELVAKYGLDAIGMINSRSTGNARYVRDRFDNGPQGAFDGVSTVARGFGNSVGGIAALGLGLVNDDAGAWASEKLGEANAWVDENQSPSLKARRQANRVSNALTSEDNKAIYDQEKQTDGTFVAGLRRIGRDAMSSVGNAIDDPVMLSEGVLDATGSLLAGGPIAKGAAVVGKVAVGQLLKRGVIAEAAALKASKFGAKITMPTTIGAMEAGGTYTQTVQQVMSMSHEGLMRTSEDYRGLIEDGWNPEDAKTEIATSAGLTAAAIQFPVAAATGTLVSKFEANPFKGVGSALGVAKNSASEAIEEAIQSGSGAAAGNFGVSAFADPNQDMLAGVGEQAGLGGLFGSMSAGVAQGPSAAFDTALGAAKLGVRAAVETGTAITGFAKSKVNRITEEAEASSPISNQAVSASVKEALSREQELNAQVQADIDAGVYTPEQGQDVLARMGKLHETMKMDPTELDDLPIDPVVKSMIASADDRFDALNLASAVAKDTSKKMPTRIGAAIFINNTLERVGGQIINDLNEAYDPLPDENPVTDTLRGYEGILVALSQDPALVEARQVAQSYVQKLKAESVSAQAIETEDGQTAAKAVASVAQSNPESVPAELAGLVLEQYRLGKVKLSDGQAKSLESVDTISRAGETYKLRAKKLDLPEKKLSLTDIVSGQITNSGTDNPDGTRSAAGHVKYVMQAVNAGNTALAADRLKRMMAFSQHMQNKLVALNQSFQSGTASKSNLTKYQALSPSGAFQESLTGVWLNPKAGPSVALAQRISLDAEILGTMANELALSMPALGVNPIELGSLPAELEGPAEVVARRFRKGLATVEPVVEPVAEPIPTPTPVKPVATEPVKVDPVVEAKPKTTVKAENKATEAVDEPTKPEPVTNIRGSKLDAEWTAFTKESGTLGIPRGDMPQIPRDSRGALTNFLAARGIDSVEETVRADSLKPTQAEFSEARVERSGKSESGRAILVSKDDHVVDGHHQWMFLRDLGADIRVIRLDAPIRDLIRIIKEMPSVTTSETKPVERPEEKSQAPAEITTTQRETEPAPKTEPEIVEPQTMEQAFPDLYDPKDGPVRNWFRQAYKLSKTPISKLFGLESPAAFISGALKSQEAFIEALGKVTDKTLTADLVEAYNTYLGNSSAIADRMNTRLANLLKRPLNKNTTKTFADALVDGFDGDNEVNGFPRGKVLNLVEQQEDGSFQYNAKLMEAAILAGLQWVVSASSRTRVYDAEGVAKLLGISEADAAEYVDWFKNGVWTTDAKRTLAAMIIKYWGVSPNANAPQGYVLGIAEGMAAEVIRGLEATGMITDTSDNIAGKTMSRLLFNADKEALYKDLSAFPSAIEDLVLIEREDTYYIGQAPDRVPANQLHGSPVPLQQQTQDAVKAAQETPYQLNLSMLSLVESLGAKGVEFLWGKGNPTGTGINVNTAKTITGFNRTITAAHGHLMNLVSELRNRADTLDENLDDQKVYFRYGVSSVGRLQMQGRANPQASKLIREVLLPTWSTLDLSRTSNPDYQGFMLAIAQHLGIKVHKTKVINGNRTAVDDVQDELGSKYAEVVEMLSVWDLANESDAPLDLEQKELQLIKDTLGNDLSVAAVHSLLEYARYLNAAEKSSFRTGLYIEADGVTDGPVNALINLVAGRFSDSWLDLMNRGGMYLGRAQVSLNDYVNRGKEESQDLYQLTTNYLYDHLGGVARKLGENDDAWALNDSLRVLMSDLLPDLEINANGDIEFKRGIAKNPLTVTVYGSGVNGIASKLTAQIIEELYSRLSAGNPPGADTRKALKLLTTMAMDKPEFDLEVKKFSYKEINLNTGTGEDFTLTAFMKKNLQQNVLHLFATPLTSAVKEIMGDALETAKLLQQATNIQSIYLKHNYRTAIADALAAKDGKDGTLASDFLSKAELDGIFQKLIKDHPMIDTGSQVIWVGGSANADVETSAFGSDVDDKMSSPGYAFGPTSAGVSGIPYIVISTGDGQMILNALTGEDAPQGILPVFDGINMKLDTYVQDSIQINKAVYDGWMKNPIRAVEQSFSKFLELSGSSMNDDAADDVRRELWRSVMFLKDEAPTPEGLPLGNIADIQKKLAYVAGSLDARKAVLAKLNMSVDHMASASAPYVKSDGVELPADPKARLEMINQMYEEELAKQPKNEGVSFRPVADSTNENIDNFLKGIRKKDQTGVTVLDRTSILRHIDKLNVPSAQVELIRGAARSLSSKDWKVVHGTAEQLMDYARENGIKLPTNWTGNDGLTLPGSKTVFLISANSETLTHELIHAATVGEVYEHYSMDPKAERTKPEGIRADAIRRMEVLMDEFMGIDLSKVKDAETLREFGYAKDAIEGIDEDASLSDIQRKTKRLNEFMAWTLANQKLADLARKTRVKSKLGRIVDGVLAALTKLWRAGMAPSVKADVFSNLKFNTLLLMNAKPSKLGSMKDLSSLAQFRDPSYGESDRLQQLEQGFLRRISGIVKRAEQSDRVLAQDLKDQHADMMVVAANARNSAIAMGFNMTAQAASLFEVMVTAFAVDSTLDGNATTRLNDMYQYVISKLDPKDFRKDPDANDDADQQQAQDKYDFIVGNGFVANDLKKRSSLLPSFLALAAVSEELQAVLAKMDVPKSEATSDGTLDSILSTKAENALDVFARKLSGEGTNAPNIQSAVAAIIGKLAQNQAERESFVIQFVNPTGDRVDGVNDWLVRNSQELSQKAADRLQTIEEETDNKYVRQAAKAGQVIMGVVNKDISEGLSMATISTLNKGNAWTPFREIVSEVIGRTKENAPIYDMIKMVRAFSQKLRQTYRDEVPKLLAERFTRKLTSEETTSLYTGLAKTDLAVFGSKNAAKVLEMLRDDSKLKAEVARLKAEITKLDPVHAGKIERQAMDLAEYMVKGTVSEFLLRNAEAIANLYGVIPDSVRKRRGPPSQNLINAIDQLASLYALGLVPNKTRITLSDLASKEADGTSFVFGSLVAQRDLELEKSITDRGRLNHYKGHVPTETKAGSSLIVSKDDPKTHADLLRRGYVRVEKYKGSRAERYMGSMSYYFAPLTGKSAFNQGIAQNIRQTFNGVDPVTGFSLDTHGVGRIVQQEAVKAITASRGSNNKGQPEALMPVFDQDGSIIAYERSMDPAQLHRLERESDLLKVIGIWRGRQSEERAAIEVNKELVNRLHDIWINRGVGREDEYVDLLDPKSHKDPVVADAVKLFTSEMLEEIKQTYGGDGFMVRKDMVNDSIGYRSASLGDLWTGVTRIPPETAKVAANIATAIAGPKAYQYLVTGEKLLQNFVGDAKNTIVVRSIVVPVANIVSNVYQLVSRGVPLNDIVRGMPKKLAEVRSYHANRLLEVRLENEILVNKDNLTKLKPLQTRLQSIRDSHRRLSIWPLIEAGEFSSVSEATVSREDSTLLEGKMSEYVESLVGKLPASVQTAGRYAIISRDTALYQGLQRTVEYGDFLAKAILYDELTKRKKLSPKEALVTVSDEFVNYDRLPGRFRGALESNGLAWFWHFKLRAAKIAVSMVRNNPLHVLLAGLVPTPDFIGTIGSPLGDNAFSIALEGKTGYSVGPMMGVHAQALNPWGNLLGF